MTKIKIPDFKTLEESAEYWDAHSFADHIDDTEPVEIEVQLEGHKLVLDIDEELSEKLVEIARKKRQSCKKLVNSWIREKIVQEGIT
jgi:predicted HicB family RNase H-like nuclease